MYTLDQALFGSIEGGMLGLMINRDRSQQDFSEVAEDIRSENMAWMANVGIIRALESGAVAAT